MRNSEKVLFKRKRKEKKESTNGDTCARSGKGAEVEKFLSGNKVENETKKNKKTHSVSHSVTQTMQTLKKRDSFQPHNPELKFTLESVTL